MHENSYIFYGTIKNKQKCKTLNIKIKTQSWVLNV